LPRVLQENAINTVFLPYSTISQIKELRPPPWIYIYRGNLNFGKLTFLATVQDHRYGLVERVQQLEWNVGQDKNKQ